MWFCSTRRRWAHPDLHSNSVAPKIAACDQNWVNCSSQQTNSSRIVNVAEMPRNHLKACLLPLKLVSMSCRQLGRPIITSKWTQWWVFSCSTRSHLPSCWLYAEGLNLPIGHQWPVIFAITPSELHSRDFNPWPYHWIPRERERERERGRERECVHFQCQNIRPAPTFLK